MSEKLRCPLCGSGPKIANKRIAELEAKLARADNNLLAMEQRAETYLLRNKKLEAKIDWLMFEYCPDEMSPEQIKNWGRHQRPADDELEQTLGKGDDAKPPGYASLRRR